MKDIGYPLRLNKEIIKLIAVFSNESFNEYEQARCYEQLIIPRFHDKAAILLKCKSTPV